MEDKLQKQARSINVQARRERKEPLFAKPNMEEQFSIEKVLGATIFEGTADPVDVEK